MKGFVGNIQDWTEHNRDFRRVLYTGPNLQLVLMSLEPGEDIGEEVHEDTDQFFRLEAGSGVVSIDGHDTVIDGETAVVVPAGARHNIRNTGATSMKLYTVYAPPHHEDGTTHRTKVEAAAASEHFTGKATE